MCFLFFILPTRMYSSIEKPSTSSSQNHQIAFNTHPTANVKSTTASIIAPKANKACAKSIITSSLSLSSSAVASATTTTGVSIKPPPPTFTSYDNNNKNQFTYGAYINNNNNNNNNNRITTSNNNNTNYSSKLSSTSFRTATAINAKM